MALACKHPTEARRAIIALPAFPIQERPRPLAKKLRFSSTAADRPLELWSAEAAERVRREMLLQIEAPPPPPPSPPSSERDQLPPPHRIVKEFSRRRRTPSAPQSPSPARAPAAPPAPSPRRLVRKETPFGRPVAAPFPSPAPCSAPRPVDDTMPPLESPPPKRKRGRPRKLPPEAAPPPTPPPPPPPPLPVAFRSILAAPTSINRPSESGATSRRRERYDALRKVLEEVAARMDSLEKRWGV